MATMAFDANYYLAQYQDVREAVAAGKITAEQHWKLYGSKEERNPNAEFNTAYYASHNTDVVASGMNYLDHYLKYGSAEAVAGKRLPNASWESIDLTKFDKNAYLAANQDVKASGMDALQHYMLYGRFEASRDGTAKLIDGTVVTTPKATTPGATFTLTNGADNLSPNSAVAATKTTSGDDLIRSPDAGAGKDTLETVDFIDGGAGNDTLTVSALRVTQTPMIKNIETINITDAIGVALDMKDSSGYTALNSVSSVTGSSFTNVDKAATVAVKDNAAVIAAFGVGYSADTGSTDSVKLQLADANVTTLTVANIETVNLESATGSLTAVTNNTVGLAATAAQTVNITGSQALTLNMTLAAGNVELKTVDGSAATGALTVTSIGAAVNALTIKGGSGADTLNFVSAAGKAHTLDAGAGADTVTLLGDKAHSVTLGDGNDVVTFGATAANVANLAGTDTTEAKLITAAIKVTDFASGDKLSVGSAGTSKVALTGSELSAIAKEANLAAAITKAVSFGAGADGETYAFAFQGNTYVFIDEDAGTPANVGVSAGDGLVQLVGYTTELTAAQLTLI